MSKQDDADAIAERMKPGVLSSDGFIGTDPRPLADIIAADGAEVERLGLSHRRVAAALGRALAAAAAGLGTPVALHEHLTAVHREAMGRIPCPFGGCGVFQKGEVELTDSATGEKVVFSPLSVHLVGVHGFYQGRGSRYRLEAAALARLLGPG